MAGEVSTVFVVGFPVDAHPRELDNLCRFMPGFADAKVVTNAKGVTLFAMFDCGTNAQSALFLMNGQSFDRMQPGEPLRAQMAKSNMRSSGGAAPAAQYGTARAWAGAGNIVPSGQPPPPEGPHPNWDNMHAEVAPFGGKRPRIAEDPSGVDTVAAVGAADAGFDETRLRTIFESMPGYCEFKGNPRMGGGFAKFASAAHAVQAIDMCRMEGVPCEMAKSSMGAKGGGDGGKGGGGYIVPAPGGLSWGASPSAGAPKGGGKDGKRPRIPEDPNQVDTVASMGAENAGFDADSLHAFYQQLPGFVAFKPNPRMGGGFAKFASAEHAVAAVNVAQEQGVPAEIARSSMSGTSV